MSYNIGKKINALRVGKKISQDDIATYLGMTRQRFSRIENGQTDISYAVLTKIAEYMAVPVAMLTVADEETDLVLLFREYENSSEVEDSVNKIQNILRTFHSHEKLYYRMKEMNSEN